MKFSLLWGAYLISAAAALTAPTIMLNENFNSSNGGFTASSSAQTEQPWTYGNGSWSTGGSQGIGAPTFSHLLSPTMAVPVSGTLTISFDHRHNFEYDGTRWDGGQVQVSVNGGPMTAITAFSLNGYNGVVGGNNLLHGTLGFTAVSTGYATPTLIHSVATIGNLNGGDQIRVQFSGAWDEFTVGTRPNWVVDNVLVQVDVGPIFLLNQPFSGGNGGFTVGPSPDVQQPWVYGPNAGVGGGGAWTVGGSDSSIDPTSSPLLSPDILVTAPGGVTLIFDHRYNFEFAGNDAFDGGQVLLSINGGAFHSVASFSSNGYNGFVTSSQNILQDQPAFVGASPGYFTPAYIRSTASLGSFKAGDILRVQWLGAWDSSVLAAPPNWVVDNVMLRVDAGAPIITSNPTDQTVKAGDLIAMQVVASGNGPYAYQWFYNAASLPGATNANLFIPDAQSDKAGIYHVAVRNAAATVSSPSALVIVSNPPVIVDQPSQENSGFGDFAQFCMGLEDNDQPVRLQWRLNGVNIPGATNGCYEIDPITLADQGSYDCVVTDGVTTIRTASAELIIPEIPRPQPQDGFTSRQLLTGSSGLVGGSNRNTTHQSGEPNHAGEPGSKSVWFRWIAPAGGIATFSTIGSGFDTLLAIYTGTGISSLTPRGADEDRAGVYNSHVTFNTQANVEYQIALDGFGGASGDYALSWQLDTGAGALPVIVTPPASATVALGAPYTFTVQATGNNLTYQWFFRGSNIAGATQSSVTIASAQPALVGAYFVRVTSGSRSIETRPAFLEIGTYLNARSTDKPENLLLPAEGGGQSGEEVAPASLPTSFAPVTAGSVGTHIMANTSAATSSGETTPCGTLGGASQWFGLVAEDDGLLVVDTLDSDFDTVLAVYSGPAEYSELILLQLVLVSCDDNSADGVRSRVTIPAKAGTHYYVLVDGVNGAKGTIQLHWSLEAAAVLTQAAQRELLMEDHDVILGSTGAATPGLRFQWQLNGTNLVGATNTALPLWRVRMDQAGDYKLATFNGTAASFSTLLPVAVARLRFTWTPSPTGGRVDVNGLATHAVTFEQNAALSGAWTVLSPRIDPGLAFQVNRTFPGAANQSYFRVRLVP